MSDPRHGLPESSIQREVAMSRSAREGVLKASTAATRKPPRGLTIKDCLRKIRQHSALLARIENQGRKHGQTTRHSAVHVTTAESATTANTSDLRIPNDYRSAPYRSELRLSDLDLGHATTHDKSETQTRKARRVSKVWEFIRNETDFRQAHACDASRSPGPKSLLQTCVNLLPAVIASEETRRRETDKDDKSSVLIDVFEYLDLLAGASPRGWTPLKYALAVCMYAQRRDMIRCQSIEPDEKLHVISGLLRSHTRHDELYVESQVELGLAIRQQLKVTTGSEQGTYRQSFVQWMSTVFTDKFRVYAKALNDVRPVEREEDRRITNDDVSIAHQASILSGMLRRGVSSRELFDRSCVVASLGHYLRFISRDVRNMVGVHMLLVDSILGMACVPSREQRCARLALLDSRGIQIPHPDAENDVHAEMVRRLMDILFVIMAVPHCYHDVDEAEEGTAAGEKRTISRLLFGHLFLLAVQMVRNIMQTSATLDIDPVRAELCFDFLLRLLISHVLLGPTHAPLPVNIDVSILVQSLSILGRKLASVDDVFTPRRSALSLRTTSECWVESTSAVATGSSLLHLGKLIKQSPHQTGVVKRFVDEMLAEYEILLGRPETASHIRPEDSSTVLPSVNMANRPPKDYSWDEARCEHVLEPDDGLWKYNACKNCSRAGTHPPKPLPGPKHLFTKPARTPTTSRRPASDPPDSGGKLDLRSPDILHCAVSSGTTSARACSPTPSDSSRSSSLVNREQTNDSCPAIEEEKVQKTRRLAKGVGLSFLTAYDLSLHESHRKEWPDDEVVRIEPDEAVAVAFSRMENAQRNARRDDLAVAMRGGLKSRSTVARRVVSLKDTRGAAETTDDEVRIFADSNDGTDVVTADDDVDILAPSPVLVRRKRRSEIEQIDRTNTKRRREALEPLLNGQSGAKSQGLILGGCQSYDKLDKDDEMVIDELA